MKEIPMPKPEAQEDFSALKRYILDVAHEDK